MLCGWGLPRRCSGQRYRANLQSLGRHTSNRNHASFSGRPLSYIRTAGPSTVALPAATTPKLSAEFDQNVAWQRQSSVPGCCRARWRASSRAKCPSLQVYPWRTRWTPVSAWAGSAGQAGNAGNEAPRCHHARIPASLCPPRFPQSKCACRQLLELRKVACLPLHETWWQRKGCVGA